MALRRWVNLARYDGAEMLIAAQCPPDGRNRLVVRGYSRSDLTAFGFERKAEGLWLGEQSSFKTSDLNAWFPGFDPKRDLSEQETGDFLIGYEDLDLVDDSVSLDDLIKRSNPRVTAKINDEQRSDAGDEARTPSFTERVAAIRAVVSSADVFEIVTGFPEESADAPFDGLIEENVRQWYLKQFALPANDKTAARKKLGRLSEAARAELARDVSRYNDLRTQGIDALSDYDIEVAYSGDALSALRQALRLKEAHVLYQRRMLAALDEADAAIDSANVEVRSRVASDNEQPAESHTLGPEARLGRQVKSAQRQRERIEDAGEKIGGARKDFYAKRLGLDDLEAMNDRERIDLVTKENIWPRKSFEQAREDGIDCRVTLFVNALRRDLPAGISKPGQAETYIEFVSKLRDVTEALSQPEEIGTWSGSFRDALLETGLVEGDENRRAVKAQYQELFSSSTKGRTFLYRYLLDTGRAFNRSKSHYDGHSFRVGDEWLSPANMDSDQLYVFIAARQMVANERRAKTSASRNDADEVDYLSRPHLDHLKRSGLPDERGGRDIKPDDFLSTFGFRACEFGNWLPDIERQDVLNRAYDALTTLARVLRVEKTFLSLNSTLALAFGSRGIGKALAHYEPARKVINLTRLKGAGALAHEWFHALDDHLGERVRAIVKESSGRNYISSDTLFASELFLGKIKTRGSSSKLNEIAQWNYLSNDMRVRLGPLIEAVNSMTIRRFTEEEAKAAADSNYLSSKYTIKNRVCSALRLVLPESDIATLNDLADRISAQAFIDIENGELLSLRLNERHPLVARIKNMRPQQSMSTSATRELGVVLYAIDIGMKELPGIYEVATNHDALIASEHMKQILQTKYFKDAKKFDEKKAKPYWSSIRELAARAFEAHIQDRITNSDAREDYLVHGTEPERFESAPNSPYPLSHDRESVNAAFEKLVEFAKAELLASVDQEDDVTPMSRPKAA